jgi:hypothetical protein
MGILTDIVIASRHDAGRVAASTSPLADFDGFDAKGLDTVKLGTLANLLRDEPAADAPAESVPFLAGNQDQGPWVFEVPPHVVSGLADLASSDELRVGDAWAKTDEFDRVPSAHVRALLGQLVQLAKRARSSSASMLVRMSL